MNSFRSRNRTVLAAAIGAVLMFGAIAHVDAQERSGRKSQREEAKQPAAHAVEQYPQATRTSPETRASAKVGRKLQSVVDLYDADKGAEARALADEIIANEKANAYDKSFAAQIGAQVAYDADDSTAAMTYLNQVLQFDGLDNNGHYGAMMMLGQLQMQEEQYAPSLATFDRLFAETKAQKPEHLAIKGNILYRMERYPEAAEVLKQAIAASPEPKADWTQLLMATYFESGQSAEAAKLAEGLAANNPGDKKAQMNLVASYLQTSSYDKAAAVLEKLHAAGQLTTDREYRQLYSSYLNIDGREQDAARVISEGLQKGVLKPEFETYQALAQSYYFSDQIKPAIDAYTKAAPLAPDGETYLNLARALWNADRIPEAKAAATQAIAKGLKRPEEARKILALPGG